jgi:hypothetical protein
MNCYLLVTMYNQSTNQGAAPSSRRRMIVVVIGLIFLAKIRVRGVHLWWEDVDHIGPDDCCVVCGPSFFPIFILLPRGLTHAPTHALSMSLPFDLPQTHDVVDCWLFGSYRFHHIPHSVAPAAIVPCLRNSSSVQHKHKRPRWPYSCVTRVVWC